MRVRFKMPSATMICLVMVAGLAAAWTGNRIVLGGLAVDGYGNRSSERSALYTTGHVKRGDLVLTIGATGTVEPEEVIDVGAQVAGQILAFGTDADSRPVDYGSVVTAGTVLARIDDSLYAADAASARAKVKAAEAGVLRARADRRQLSALFDQAERDWRRAERLGPAEALSRSRYDGYRAAYASAMANVAVGSAAIAQAEAGLTQTRAELRRAERSLEYCTIVSPVDGVVIDRRVNIGQTVVASLNAPSLFLIAKDLTRMQVWVAVNEADIGSIRPGQTVRFTVDAFPGETFRGEVAKIRLNAAMTQNVVTYTVEIDTANPNNRLLPYLTADVQFELQHRQGVLQVPDAALHWTPSREQIAPSFRETLTDGADVMEDADDGWLWMPDGDFVRPIRVRVGASNGSMTEVAGSGLAEGMAVVTGMTAETAASDGGSNPFTPQFLRSSRRAG